MIDMRVKHLFFDKPKVQRAVGEASRRALSRGGAFIRQRARSSIRKRKGVSPPGKPPSSHTGLLKKFIYFSYDPGSESVVIGPEKFTRGDEIPRVLEFGGAVVTRRAMVLRRGNTGRDNRGRFTQGKRQFVPKGTRLTYKPRPYMGPALDKERASLPKQWRNSVRGG